MQKQRDDAREDSKKGAYDYCNLHNKLRDTENELYYSNERLQDADRSMNDERKEFRDNIQELNDQSYVDEEKIRSLNQEVWNTECDRDEYHRKFAYASQEHQRLEQEHQQLEASLAEKDETINKLQALDNDAVSEPIATVLPPYIYTQSNKEIGLYQPITTTPTLRNTAPEQATANEEETDPRGIELENLRDVHAKCGEDLEKQVAAKDGELAEKDEEIRVLRAEKKTADETSAGTVANLQTKLREKGEEVADLEEANGTLAVDSAPSEVSRHAHAQCDESSTSQNSRIGELVTAKEQLEEIVRVKANELGSLQERLTSSHNNLEELEGRHAACSEHADAQALGITRLCNENVNFRGSIQDLSQQLTTAKDKHAHLIQEGQLVENQNKTLSDLQTCSQREIRSLQSQIEALNQTINYQQQRIQILETNCPNCQKLREALDEVAKDVEMSDDISRDEMKREIRAEVRAELRSQVADDLRRQLRREVEREMRDTFQKHYSDLLASNSKRMQEQDRLISEKDAALAKIKNTVNHAACQKRADNLESTINKLRQDAKIAQGRCSRINDDAKHDREQLNHATKAIENLKSELELIKADQRRALNINPLQSKVTKMQRELDNMKEDRKRARDNCTFYSNQVSDLRRKNQALEGDLAAFRERSSLDGDNMMDDECTEEPVTVQDTIRTRENEVTRLSKELHEGKSHDHARDQVMNDHATPSSNQSSLPSEEGEQQWPEGSFPYGQSSAAPAINGDEAAATQHEVNVREARDGKKAAVYSQPAAATNPTSERSKGGSSQSLAQVSGDEADDKSCLPNDGIEESDDELEEGEILNTRLASQPARKYGRRPARVSARQPTNNPIKKRKHDEYSDGEADDEGEEDHRKKARITVIEDGMHRIKASGNISAVAQDDKAEKDKDME